MGSGHYTLSHRECGQLHPRMHELSHTTHAIRVRSVAQLCAYVGEAVHTLDGDRV